MQNYTGRESMLTHAYGFYNGLEAFSPGIEYEASPQNNRAIFSLNRPTALDRSIGYFAQLECKRAQNSWSYETTTRTAHRTERSELFFMVPRNSLDRFNTHLPHWNVAVTNTKGGAGNSHDRTV